MQRRVTQSAYTCNRCLRVSLATQSKRYGSVRRYSDAPQRQQSQDAASTRSTADNVEQEKGAMSRRLSEMSDSMLESSGRRASKAVEEAGFSEELKQQLQDRIAGATFASDNAQAIARANLPLSAGAGTKDIAGARPWTGTESVEDATLRMLDDAHKKMRVATRPPSVRMPRKIDTGRPSGKSSGGLRSAAQGTRLANARDKTSIYSSFKDADMSESEREQMRKELKERFTPGARAIPGTLQGLASLANERIEDAIARGQFKNLPRGKPIERDYNASSPFLDTTEYFMNKIIQKQDIVPPWIEKQQELVSTASKFRARLRSDWKRHVARLIASRGGSLAKQMALAEAYARAEAVDNPPRAKVESVTSVDSGRHLSQVTVAGEPELGSSTSPGETIVVTETPLNASTSGSDGESEAHLGTTIVTTLHGHSPESPPGEPIDSGSAMPSPQVSPPPPPPPPPVVVEPFRDPAWLATELTYHELAIAQLNSLARSYNLMAPDVAKKPYYSLERELRACYADVAPLVAGEIRERASIPARKVVEVRHREGGVLERFSGGPASRVHDEVRPKYGFREFWRDLFATKEKG